MAILMVGGLACYLWFNQAQFVAIENHSGQPIAELRITLAGQASTFRDVASGAAVSAPVGSQGSDDFAVEGKLSDGTLIRGHGVIGGHNLVVLPGGMISIRPANKSS
jgi:hypothetical protein